MIKTVICSQQKKQIDLKQNREPKIDLDKHSQLIFDKEQRQISATKIIFSTNGARATRQPRGWSGGVAREKQPLQTLHPPQQLTQIDHRYKCKMQNYRTPGTFPVVQGFKLCTSTAEGAGSIPGGGN